MKNKGKSKNISSQQPKRQKSLQGLATNSSLLMLTHLSKQKTLCNFLVNLSNLRLPSQIKSFGSTVILALFTLMSSCVTVQVGDKKPTKAESVVYSEPADPFVLLKKINDEEGFDKAWKNHHSGALISYYSECYRGAEPSLKEISEVAESAFDEIKEKRSEPINIDNRTGLRTRFFGTLDGVEMSLITLVYKKNGCSYSLNFSTKGEPPAPDQLAFDEFVKKFKGGS